MIPMSYYSRNLLDENGFFSPCRFVEAYVKELTKGMADKNAQHFIKQQDPFSVTSCVSNNEPCVEHVSNQRLLNTNKVLFNTTHSNRHFQSKSYELHVPPPPPPPSNDITTQDFHTNETSLKNTCTTLEDSLMDFEEISEESDTTLHSSSTPHREPMLTTCWEKSTEVCHEAKVCGNKMLSEKNHEEIMLMPVEHKLKLVLDLDNTLLHACSLSKLCNIDIPLQDFLSPENDCELYTFRLSSFFNQLYHVKFRPGVRRFLKELSLYCDMGIHTNATHEYADVIVSILDPDYSLFQGRVASREDETTKDHKKNMGRLFRVDDLDIASLLILDDRKDVWDTMYHPNIIKCGVYDYLDARKNVLIEKYCQSHEKNGIRESTTVSVDINPFMKENCSPSQTSLVTNEDKKIDSIEMNSCAQDTSKSCKEQTCTLHKTTVTNETSPYAFNKENHGDCLNHEEETTSPFLDNPLLKKSQITVPQNLDETDNYEDDDVITLDDKHTQTCDHSTSLQNNQSLTCGIPTLQKNVSTQNETLFQSDSTSIAAHFGVSQDSVNENMRLAMKLNHQDQALIDYDTQLNELRNLIIHVALEYNRQKSNPLTSDTVNVAQILTHTRQSILQGVVAQTVGMYKSKTSHPEYGWQDNGPVHRRRLVKLGAQVVDSPVPDLTHIIAMRATQTIDRVRQERGQDVQYVHALWLHACESTWKRIPENWFPAFPLLEKYNNSPPMKPWLDHWQLIALQNETINDRLLNVLKTQSTLIQENHKMALETNTKIGLGHSQSKTATLPRRQHLVLSKLSAGAEVWSAHEHISLTYDTIESLRLKKRLNLPLTVQESQSLMQMDKQQITRKPVWCPFETKYFKKSFNMPRSNFRHTTNHRKWEKRKRNTTSTRDYPHHYSIPRNLLSHNRCWFKDTYTTQASTNPPDMLPKRQLLSSDPQSCNTLQVEEY